MVRLIVIVYEISTLFHLLRNLNKLSINYQWYQKSARIDTFEQNIYICQSPKHDIGIILIYCTMLEKKE